MGHSGGGSGPIRGASGNGTGPIRGQSGNGSGPADMSSTSMVSFDVETFNKLKDACTLLGNIFSDPTEKSDSLNT
jgi:hypothetical protein